ncbi:hypothetical protein [Serinicoccus sp. LYQ131]|uniref:hypothetical protein n=1 Tax=Serinicoccus sp. LYQ131 TaxID=3378797 RepID=UPI0038530CD5
MTAESDDLNAGITVPESGHAQETTDGAPVLDRDALDDLTNDEAAEVGAAAANALEATTEGSREQVGVLIQQAVAPQISETTRRINEFVAGGAYKSILESGALAGTKTLSELVAGSAFKSSLESGALAPTHALSGFAEVLGRSTADRAAFSLASGLRASDSVSSVIGMLMADTGGLGIARSTLVAVVGESLKGFTAADLGLPASSTLSGFANNFGPSIEVSGFRDALGQSEAVRSIVNGFAGAEIARTRSLAMQQLVAASGITDLIGSDKMVASWRQSLLSEATARSLIGTMAVPETGASLLRDVVAANTATARVVGRFAELNKASVLAPAVSARPTRELRCFLAGMSVAPDLHELTFAVRASRSVAGIAAADLLVADGTIEDEAGELFEAEIVEPWLNGPEALRSLLFFRLGALDPHVPDLLRGAWTQVEQGGPAATSMASHAVQEAIDRTLRALAPSDLVLRLFAAGRLPSNSVYDKNGERHPTRAGRIAAALHERHPGETKLIAAQAKAIAASVTYLTENVQGGKHASNGTVGLVRTWLVSVEATFTQLLYETGDG